MSKTLPIIGWREWVSLPSLGIAQMRAKIDSGARTSALHAFDIVETHRGRKTMLHFKVNPNPKQPAKIFVVKAPLLDRRHVKDSHGKMSLRPVIAVTIKLGELSWDIEVTLIDRTDMNFRMLLGRQAIRGHFLIHPGRSYVLGR